MKIQLNILYIYVWKKPFWDGPYIGDFSRESVDWRTDRQMDGRYQVHYLPRFAVDNHGIK